MSKLEICLVSAAYLALIGCTGTRSTPSPEPTPTPTAPSSEPTAQPPAAPVVQPSPAAQPHGDGAVSPNHGKPANHHGHGAKKLTPKDAELAAYKAALPVFKEHCADCHTPKKGKKKKKGWKHFTMAGYPFGGHHAHEIGKTIRRSLGLEGKKATMPKDDPGAVKGKDLALIVAWSRAFDKANPPKPGGHKHHHGRAGSKRNKRHATPKKGKKHDHVRGKHEH